MTTTFNSMFAQVPGLASSFDDIFNSTATDSTTPPIPAALPAPRDIHCVNQDDADHSI